MKFSYSQNYYYYLKKGMATHSSILAWRIPSTEEPCGLHGPWGRKESDTTEQLTLPLLLILLLLHVAVY